MRDDVEGIIQSCQPLTIAVGRKTCAICQDKLIPHYLVERKNMFKAVCHLEDIADCRANAMQTCNSAEPVLAPEELLMPADWSDADQDREQSVSTC